MADKIQGLLNQAADIVILEKHPAENRYRFAFPLAGDFARQCYDATLSIDAGLPEFQEHWEFDEGTGQINGSSPNLLARLMRVLRPKGLELPDALDLIELDRQKKLKSGSYIDCGIAVYSNSEPNREVARILIEKGKQEGWKLPLLYSPADLDYIVADGHAKIVSGDKPRRVVSGEKAGEVLKGFFKGSSGACRAYRGWSGGWLAGWDAFADSGSVGLVDFVCAEGTRENLQEGYFNLSARKYNARKEELQGQIAQLDIERKAEESAVLDDLKA
jgi:hypothetical protein